MIILSILNCNYDISYEAQIDAKRCKLGYHHLKSE